MSFFSKSFELLNKMILSLCVVFMDFELNCVDNIFCGECFSIFREKYTVIYKNFVSKEWNYLDAFKKKIN